MSFHQDAARVVSIGDEVTIAHDQSNRHDLDAVTVATSTGELLGHLPARGAINSRLLVGHRGGVWSGVIVDKLEGETIGLRVKILTLVGHRTVGFGADVAGRRDQIEEPIVPTGSIADVAVHIATGDQSPPPARRVTAAASGRLLGEWLAEGEGRVRVRRANGETASYPAAVVKVIDPVTPAPA